MKGKITKDILLRVGQGVMRIPRNKTDESTDKAEPYSPSTPALPERKKNPPTNTSDRS